MLEAGKRATGIRDWLYFVDRVQGPGEIWSHLVGWQKASHEAGDKNKDLDAQVEGSLIVTPW